MAMAVAWLSRDVLRPMILVMLIVAAAYTFLHKDFGAAHRLRFTGMRERIYALLLGGCWGFMKVFSNRVAGVFSSFFSSGFSDLIFCMLRQCPRSSNLPGIHSCPDLRSRNHCHAVLQA